MNGMITNYDREFYNNVSVIKKQMMEINQSLKTIAGSCRNTEMKNGNTGTDPVENAGKDADMDTGISFYVAESSEFPSMGEYAEGLTLEEAVRKFNRIDPERMHAIPALGAAVRIEEGHADHQIDLIRGSRVITSPVIETRPDPYEDPRVRKALNKIAEMIGKGLIPRVSAPKVHDRSLFFERILEDVFDMTQMFDYLNVHGKISECLDSREVCGSIVQMAKDFEREHKNTDWSDADYIETVCTYAENRLLGLYGKD